MIAFSRKSQTGRTSGSGRGIERAGNPRWEVGGPAGAALRRIDSRATGVLPPEGSLAPSLQPLSHPQGKYYYHHHHFFSIIIRAIFFWLYFWPFKPKFEWIYQNLGFSGQKLSKLKMTNWSHHPKLSTTLKFRP